MLTNFVRTQIPYQSVCLRLINTQASVKDGDGDQSVQLKEWLAAKPTSGIPGPTKLQAIRAFLPGGVFYNKTLPEFLGTARRMYGDFYVFPGMFGKPPIFITFNADDFPVAVRSEGIWPKRRILDTMLYHRRHHRKDLFDGMMGLIGSNDEVWGNLRTKVNPILMQPKSMRLYVDKMQEVNNEFLERIREIRDPVTLEMPNTFDNEINRLTFESVAIVALDQDLGLIRKNRDNPEIDLLFKSFKEAINLVYELDVLPSIWKIVKTPKFYKLMKAVDNVTFTIQKYVNQSVERIEREEKVGISSTGEKSVLEKLLKIDKRFAMVMALDLLMAGVDNTTSTLAGILICIAKNPEKQTMLREELRGVLPNKDSLFTSETMQNLPYLRACIKEGMRMYPAFAGIPRSTGQDVVLSGYRVPKYSDVALGGNDMMKEEKYCKNPSMFLPERWLRGSDSEQLLTNRFLYMPFGFGPRSCVGKRLVDLELEVTIGRLVRNFYLEFNYPTENAFRGQLINQPVIPLNFKFTEVEN